MLKMNTPRLRGMTGLLAMGLCLAGTQISRAEPPAHVRLPDVGSEANLLPPTRGDDPMQKLTPDLLTLYRQISRTQGDRKTLKYTPKQLKDLFGLDGKEKNPALSLTLKTDGTADAEALKAAGATVRVQNEDDVFVSIPLRRLPALAKLDFVKSVALAPRKNIPEPPPAVKERGGVRGAPTDNPAAFDAQGMTGRGVLVAVIDTGIDWRHQDFTKPDGTTRIVAIWDQFDNSWAESKGKIGSKPPQEYADGTPVGTVYTQEQINAALKGQGTVNTLDRVGHGTACAGTAAGNGGRPAGSPDAVYPGVAPEADLIVVKISQPQKDGHGKIVEGRGLSGDGEAGAHWIKDMAAARKQPVVINMSYGGQGTAHDGTEPEERDLNGLVGAGKPGAAICVAAGNEGHDVFHAVGKFAPKRAGQQDTESEPIELFVRDADGDPKSPNFVNAFMDHRDTWVLYVIPLGHGETEKDPRNADSKFYGIAYTVDTDGKLKATSIGNAVPDNPEGVGLEEGCHRLDTGTTTDRLSLGLWPGNYLIIASARDKAPSGRFDLYLPNSRAMSFGQGVVTTGLVGSPGSADNAITVGSYDFRASWQNAKGGEPTFFNLTLGDISGYSSPGYRRDGAVKPDITAPAHFAISTLAAGCNMAADLGDSKDYYLTPDKKHIAWDGTSAATPYTVGVIALLMQKNPTLDAAQIRQILSQTAIKDRFTGAVPNPQWGYGKINPAGAIRVVPAPKGPDFDGK